MRETLANKQKAELDEYTASLEKKHAEVHPKYSSKLLDMRYTQAQLYVQEDIRMLRRRGRSRCPATA